MNSGVNLAKREHWFLSRLSDHGVIVDNGLTTIADRMHAARAGILREGLASIVMCRGAKSGKPLDYRAVFPSVYGEPLEPQ